MGRVLYLYFCFEVWSDVFLLDVVLGLGVFFEGVCVELEVLFVVILLDV